MTDSKISTDSSAGESDPGTWLDPGSQGLGRALLSAGREERPSASALGRTLVAVGVAASALTVAGETAALGSLTGAGTASGVGGGAVGSSAVAGGVVGGGAVAGGTAAIATGTVATGTVLKSVTAALVVKWLAGGVVVGAAAFGVAEVVNTPELPSPVAVPAERHGNEQGDQLSAASAAAQGENAPAQHNAVSGKAAEPAAEVQPPPAAAEPASAPLNAGEAAREPLAEPVAGAEQGTSKSEALKAEPAVNLRASSAQGSPVAGSSAQGSPVAGSRGANKDAADWLSGNVPLPERSVAAEAKPTAEAEAQVPSELRAELRRVDQARALLDAGRAAAALAELRTYRQEFPAGRLSPEALFLEMQAQHQLGRSAEARAAARRIVERYPAGPHAGRAREILGQ
jgi:hypothetical protein